MTTMKKKKKKIMVIMMVMNIYVYSKEHFVFTITFPQNGLEVDGRKPIIWDRNNFA